MDSNTLINLEEFEEDSAQLELSSSESEPFQNKIMI